MSDDRLQKRWIERVLLVAVLLMQVALFWQLRVLLQVGRPANDAGQPVKTDESDAVSEVPLAVPVPDSVRAVPRHRPVPPQARILNAMMADAFDSMTRLQSAGHFNRGWDQLPASPTLDMRDTGTGYLVTCSIPGIRADHVGVQLEGRVLTVRAWCPSTRYPEGGRRYERRLLLPGPIGAAEAAQAHLTNGILRVHVPKGVEPDEQHVVLRLF